MGRAKRKGCHILTLTRERISEFVQRVVGSTLDQDTVLEDEFDVPGGTMGLTQDTLTDIESEIFVCEVCDWNVAREEESKAEGVCIDCYDADEVGGEG